MKPALLQGHRPGIFRLMAMTAVATVASALIAVNVNAATTNPAAPGAATPGATTRPDHRPRPQRMDSPEALPLEGMVTGYNLDARGLPESLLVKDSGGRLVQVNLNHELAPLAGAAAPVGGAVKMTVQPEMGLPDHPVYNLVTLSGANDHQLAAPMPGEPKETHVDAVIKQLNYGAHGEINGAQLDNGDLVQVPPPLAIKLKFAVGLKLVIDGRQHSMLTGHHAIGATKINDTEIPQPQLRREMNGRPRAQGQGPQAQASQGLGAGRPGAGGDQNHEPQMMGRRGFGGMPGRPQPGGPGGNQPRHEQAGPQQEPGRQYQHQEQYPGSPQNEQRMRGQRGAGEQQSPRPSMWQGMREHMRQMSSRHGLGGNTGGRRGETNGRPQIGGGFNGPHGPQQQGGQYGRQPNFRQHNQGPMSHSGQQGGRPQMNHRFGGPQGPQQAGRHGGQPEFGHRHQHSMGHGHWQSAGPQMGRPFGGQEGGMQPQGQPNFNRRSQGIGPQQGPRMQGRPQQGPQQQGLWRDGPQHGAPQWGGAQNQGQPFMRQPGFQPQGGGRGQGFGPGPQFRQNDNNQPPGQFGPMNGGPRGGQAREQFQQDPGNEPGPGKGGPRMGGPNVGPQHGGRAFGQQESRTGQALGQSGPLPPHPRQNQPNGAGPQGPQGFGPQQPSQPQHLPFRGNEQGAQPGGPHDGESSNQLGQPGKPGPAGHLPRQDRSEPRPGDAPQLHPATDSE